MNTNSQAKKHVKRLISGVFFALVLGGWWLLDTETSQTADEAILDQLYASQANDTWVELMGRVSRRLPDDTRGSRHQKFIVISGKHSVLVAHNIDLAERVPVGVGDEISLRGQYEWNQQGGVVHWTHHDPQNRHTGGWIEWRGKKFK